ncbi:uncharacterized protein LY79DRAFT_664226 [Colletotrichum navitas]|uniref:Uncharacterized protein n=1 Tax=Colletotrichum navitas TaxID=681940 RepID=A0AAD8UWB2_9PEZI|nr:uncharacterized protein LY79DRAFT_664226 [Colletotrichum navitas]KAK1561707.1 hypothetical protein LY79DRAFT_664226 [Colletotrichum navitas]
MKCCPNKQRERTPKTMFHSLPKKAKVTTGSYCFLSTKPSTEAPSTLLTKATKPMSEQMDHVKVHAVKVLPRRACYLATPACIIFTGTLTKYNIQSPNAPAALNSALPRFFTQHPSPVGSRGPPGVMAMKNMACPSLADLPVALPPIDPHAPVTHTSGQQAYNLMEGALDTCPTCKYLPYLTHLALPYPPACHFFHGPHSVTWAIVTAGCFPSWVDSPEISSQAPDRANICLGIIANAPTAKAAGKFASELLDDDALHDFRIQARGRRLKQLSSADSKRHQKQLEYLDALESLWQAGGLLEEAIHADAKGIRRLRVSDLRNLKKTFLGQADSGPQTETSTPTRPTSITPASRFNTPERARGDPSDRLPAQELTNTPVDPDFDPLDETTSQPPNHCRAFNDTTSQSPSQGREGDIPNFSDVEYEQLSFDLGGNSPEPSDNDDDMAPTRSTGGRPSPSWQTRLKEVVFAPEMDVKPEDMMSIVPSMVEADGDLASYGTSKAGRVFDFPLPLGHQLLEIQKYDKIVLLLHHGQTDGQWTCLHVVNYSAGTRNLVDACHIDCVPDGQRMDMVEGFRPSPEEAGSPDPAGESKRRFLEHWTSKVAAEDACAKATGLIPRLEKRRRRLSASQKDLTHASSAALNDVSRHKVTKLWASKVASLQEDHDDQDSDVEDMTIREATAAFVERLRAAGYNGESVEKATKDVNTAAERAKKLTCDLSAVCSSAEKVNAAMTALEKCKKQQEVLRAAITAVGLLDPEDWVGKDEIDLVVKEMAEETQEEDT